MDYLKKILQPAFDAMSKVLNGFYELSIVFIFLVINFLAPIGIVLLALAVVQVVDSFLGLIKFSQKKQANSKGFRIGFIKKFFGYASVIITVFFLDIILMKIYTDYSTHYISLVFGAIFVANEVWSIIENITVINFKKIRKRLKDVFGFGAFIAKGISDVKNGNFDDYKQKEYDNTTSESKSESEAKRNDIESVPTREFTDIER